MAGLWVDDSDADEGTGPDPDPAPDPDPDPDGNNLFLVASGDDLTGTDADDGFETEETDFIDSPSIDAGAGDDILDLYDPDIDGPVILGLDADLGAGDDAAALVSSDGTISGGEGDDAITLYSSVESTVFGDAGNDAITLRDLVAGGALALSGGDGDDVIDAAETSNVVARGDAGDDIIRVSGYDQGGAAFAIRPEGGAGDDVMIYQGAVPVVDGNPVTEASVGAAGFDPSTMLGGDGADRFEIRIGAASPAELFLDGVISGLETTTEDGNIHNLVTIGDFEPGVDLIVVESSHLPDAEGDTSISLTEDAAAGTTAIDVLFEPLSGPSYTARITVNAVGLSEDDVVFLLPETGTTGMDPISLSA